MTPKQYKKFQELCSKKFKRKTQKFNLLENDEEFEKMLTFFYHLFFGDQSFYYGIRSLCSSGNTHLSRRETRYIEKVILIKDERLDYKKHMRKIEMIEYIIRGLLIGWSGSVFGEEYLFSLKYINTTYYRDLCDYYDRMKRLNS